ncbi:hypothetical protein NQ315_015826 [Exocentrus adspersus]|uniref:MYND-type domain-containing protein n=1 Tax=Exocentrus adspersus TaxID=1586481 RepID=A0AAV8W3W7_9CUCU|nr:hypothetical protein NQ315_015826 [Exocentrus adspersus]
MSTYSHVQYNAFYYSTLCHVCKERTPDLKRCSRCRVVAYCSKEHQKADWKYHKELCKAITKTDSGENGLDRLEVRDWVEFRKYNILRAHLWQKELGRALKTFESQMWMFPRACAVCFSKNIKLDCPSCLSVSYCSEEHRTVNEEKHSKFCPALKLCMDRDLYHFHNKYLPLELDVHNIDPDINILPNSLKDLLVMYEQIDVPDASNTDQLIQFMFKADILGPAATILYGLEKSGLLIDRMLSKPELTVHIVGADMVERAWIWKGLAEFHFHWIKNLKTLDFYLVGPELLEDRPVERVASYFCDTCKTRYPKTKIVSLCELYHDVADNLEKPDIVVAFNSGLHERGSFNMWDDSIDFLTMYINVPLLLTAYTMEEIVEDVGIVKAKTSHIVTTVVGPQLNPFHHLRPIRDFQNEDIPIFHINAFLAILKMTNFAVLAALLAVVSCAWAYSAGAPESTCDDMTPKHPVEPQKSELPYKVTANKKEVKAGEVVEITVSGKTFKGFLLQVRKGDKAAGQFLIPDDDKYAKASNCHGAKGSAATHKNATDKKSITLKWKAPRAAGKYTVYATVAQDGGVFWVRKPTQEIIVN